MAHPAFGEYTIKLYPHPNVHGVVLETNFLMEGHTAKRTFQDTKQAVEWFGMFLTALANDREVPW